MRGADDDPFPTSNLRGECADVSFGRVPNVDVERLVWVSALGVEEFIDVDEGRNEGEAGGR